MYSVSKLGGNLVQIHFTVAVNFFLLFLFCLGWIPRMNSLLRHKSWLPFRGAIQRSMSQGIAPSWPLKDVRQTFNDYFVSKHDHTFYRSSPVVPYHDPTLLFANAGMNQFKPIFIGTVDPTSPLYSLKRAVNSQKCIRAGGKHNDLEDVGKDTYHHTFFEMLGTWSFGNYFKKEAIDWAYDLLVNTYKLPSDRLYASYFRGDEAMGLPCDEEAKNHWLKYLPAERVLPFDKKANFWEMGETGPCGPCSEIHFDRIGNRDASALVNNDDPDVIEIWNLVFIQFNRESDGSLKLLPNKHIDTGMGLERLTSILQGKRSNYDTDAFEPIFHKIREVCGCEPYQGKIGKEDAAQNFRDTAYRVIADHVRTLTFAISDGALPSNEGRGYVLRRILRRAVRYGLQTLQASPGFFAQLVPVVIEQFGDAYPELVDKQSLVLKTIQEEEESFSSLLKRGVVYFNSMLEDARLRSKNSNSKPMISGKEAFFLYDSLGFPIDLTQLMAQEKDILVDMEGFHQSLEEQRNRSRLALKKKNLEGRENLSLNVDQVAELNRRGIMKTDTSLRYQNFSDQPVSAQIKAIFTKSGFVSNLCSKDYGNETFGIILDRSPFYYESGGQVSDTGSLLLNDGGQMVEVLDVQSYGGYVFHLCSFPDDFYDHSNATSPMSLNASSLEENRAVHPQVDYLRRKKIVPNHTMTHMLNWVLKHITGASIEQRGSLVNDEKLRFDFTYASSLSYETLEKIEKEMIACIERDIKIDCQVVPLESASKISGIQAVFGEVYPDPVRVVSMGPSIANILNDPSHEEWKNYSLEFCGGCHLNRTSEAQSFVIVEEGSIAKGIRRISALTGQAAVEMKENSNLWEKKFRDILASSKVNESSSKSILPLFDLEDDLVSFRETLDHHSTEIGHLTRLRLRNQVDSTLRDLLSRRHSRLQSNFQVKLAEFSTLVSQSESGSSLILVIPEMGMDGKMMKKSLESIKKLCFEKVNVLCIFPNERKQHTTIVAMAADKSKVAGSTNAQEWLSKIMNQLGGKSGGKDSMAQGNVPEHHQLSQIIKVCENSLREIS